MRESDGQHNSREDQTPDLNVVTGAPAPASQDKGPQSLWPLQQPCGVLRRSRGIIMAEPCHRRAQQPAGVWEWGSSKEQVFPHLSAREY